MSSDFVYNEVHRVNVCLRCKTCVAPSAASRERHCRAHPHRLTGDVLKETLRLLACRDLRSATELRQHKPRRKDRCPRIPHLKAYPGFTCLHSGCEHSTRRLAKLHTHVRLHNRKARQHKHTPLWEECTLQTYFTAKGRIDYFVVIDEPKNETVPKIITAPSPPTPAETACFQKIERDYAQVPNDVAKEAQVVHDFGDSRSARVPWLERTEFPSHLAGLSDDAIRTSYELPRGEDADVQADTDASRLARILAAAEVVLRLAYELCSDTSPGRKMTQQRASILNEFYTGASGRAASFRSFKNASTLVKYFKTFLRLLAYYYHVVYSEDGHFTSRSTGQKLPRDIIQPTRQQTRAMEEIMEAVAAEDDLALQDAIRRFYMALICHTVGSVPFRSPVLSFCAMLSRKVRGEAGEGRGLWMEPGNFNSHLSALTWTAQLLIFDHVCREEREDEDQIPTRLSRICRPYFQQLAETPFGHILQWRLYLFKVSKAAVAKHQARWSLDGQTVVYRGLELQMSHISHLVVSEYQRAHHLLYHELMFQADDATSLHSWQLQDDLDLDDFGASWLSHPGNVDLLQDSELALLRRIQSQHELRATFLTAGDGGSKTLCPQAMAIYEANAQEFLKSLLVLCHLPPGQPLREPELLSVTWCNTARPRHIFLWEKLAMIYTQYHKGQQQSGAYKDNIRFLPKAIGDLLLTYIAKVQPLRQMFLRQRTPGALISPYVWAKLDGPVWPDGMLSTCLSKACARAQVPRLHNSNWRQISASICKEKFSAKDRANFELEESLVENIEDELDLMAMAEQGNHSYTTFNHAYAGTTTLTMNALLHRNHRACETWQSFFRFDHILGGKKRPLPTSEAGASSILTAVKRARPRRRVGYAEVELLAVTRELYHNPNMQLRVPGQRDGLLATLGPRPAEQVLLVVGTGSGKSLVFLVGVSVADAQTTILVLPMVALRGDMMRRCVQAGIRPLIWSLDCKQPSSLVIVSAEAACTERFLDYAHDLVRRQQLDRIVIDECHLTITASDYRPCMSQLGWYLRQIRTQTVWLTATLPPVMQEGFIEHNKLVKPRVIRESTNRPNVFYMVSHGKGPGTLTQKAAEMVRICCHPEGGTFNRRVDKIILYCQTRKDVAALAEMLECPMYTSECGDEDQKAAILARWLADANQPAIVATSALGVGFDYPHVRWVVHVDAPDRLSAFAQESGRAGRDGQRAYSVVILSSTWKPAPNVSLCPDREAMQLYLTQRYCSRGVLSQFLDMESDWRWCMAGEQVCQVCREPHVEPRPGGLTFALPNRVDMVFTGPEEVLRQDLLRDQVLDRYLRDLEVVGGSCCLYCRVEGRQFDHRAGACARRFDWIQAKNEAFQSRKREGKPWIARHTVCWMCYQPQEICRVADPEHEESKCRFPDVVMPVCYGVFCRPGRDAWFLRHFRRKFRGVQEYMLWLGEKASLGGNTCIQANCVAAIALGEMA